MNALIWRLHRNQALFAGAALVALTVLLVITGTRMASDYHNALSACAASNSCSDIANQLFRGDGAIIDLVNFTVVVPLLFGLFWGAPLVAKECEEGTHNLAWSQGVTRRHWLASNVAWMVTAAAVWGAGLSALVSWWRAPENALEARFTAFDVQGVVPVAYSVAAVALGIAMGSLVRRALPALAATLTTFVALRVAIAVYLRPHFTSPVTSTTANFSNGPPAHAWVLNTYLVLPKGQAVSKLRVLIGPNCPPQKGLACLARHGIKQTIVYQPDSRFWAFQGYEAAIFLALAAVFIAVSFVAVLRRDA